MTNTRSLIKEAIILALLLPFAFALFALPALASTHPVGDDNDITVTNTNNATVNNIVNVSAKTGNNDADGGDGDEGGDGGDGGDNAGSGGSGS